MNKNGVVIFKLDVANELIERGFTVNKLGYNYHNPNKIVVIFSDTPEIRNVLKEDFNITIR